MSSTSSLPRESPSDPASEPSLARTLAGGLLMGLANLVPGVSGGTMILALGLYERFIRSLADLSRLRFSRRALLFLACIAVGAAFSILTFSGIAVRLVTEQRWIMYSLFIGLTLGGAPELMRNSRPLGPVVVLAFLATLAGMLYLAFGLSSSALGTSAPALVLIGAIAAASMILPGVSGSTMLLIFGAYDLVLGAVSARELRADFLGSLGVLVPVAIGAAIGIGLLSNLLKALLARFPAPSHAALLGLLLGSVAVLMPYQEPLHPELVDKSTRRAVQSLVEGEELAAVNARLRLEIDEKTAEEWRLRYAGRSAGALKELAGQNESFTPSLGQVAASLGLVALGLLLTRLLGRKERPARA